MAKGKIMDYRCSIDSPAWKKISRAARRFSLWRLARMFRRHEPVSLYAKRWGLEGQGQRALWVRWAGAIRRFRGESFV